jgi:uncharacterized protein (TIGR02594 family)
MYEHLKNNPPLMVAEAMKFVGLKEIKGKVNNKTILGWANEIGGKVADIYKSDEIAWCGLFIAILAFRTKRVLPKDPLWALNWNTFGNRVEKEDAMLGDVLVFVRNGGGHVGLYVGEDKTAYHVLGGNQNDEVSVTRIVKSRLYGVRRPTYKNQPVSVKKYHLSASGKLSNNEA